MEQFSFWIQAIISVLSGLLVLIPLAAELVKYVRKSIQEKNWNNVLKLVMSLMVEAETNFENGADRKEWVMSQLRAMQNSLNYEIDWDVISNLIDTLCSMAKKVNNKAASE